MIYIFKYLSLTISHIQMSVIILIDLMQLYSYIKDIELNISKSRLNSTYRFRLPWCLDGKESACNEDLGSIPKWGRSICWRREWLPTSIFLPAKFHGQRGLMGYSKGGHKESNSRLVRWEDPEGWDGEGGWEGVGMGNTCGSMADSRQCMAKTTTTLQWLASN